MTTFEVSYLISQYLLFAAAVVYTVFAIFQWRAIGRQADIAEKTLVATFRPKLIVRNVKIVSDVSDESNLITLPVELYLEVANRGGSVAENNFRKRDSCS